MSDDPIDLLQVAADEAALEGLRTGRAANDPVLLLLRDLLDDVEEEPTPVPVGCGSTVLTLAGDRAPERRTVRNGALVAALTAGLVSFSGVAAAASFAPPGTPLHGLSEAVRSAIGVAVGSVTPPDPVAPASAPAPAPAPAPAEAPPAPTDTTRQGTAPAPAGAAVSAAARSQAAARQVTALLDAAEVLLREGRTGTAAARLDTAEGRLADVLPVDAAPLAQRLADLREKVEAAAAQPAQKPAKADAPKQQQAPKAKPAAEPDEVEQPAPAKKEEPAAERKSGGGGRDSGERGSDRTAEPVTPKVPDVRGQLSKDASTKPRA